MSEWITDRKPTREDADLYWMVWTTYNGKVVAWTYDGVAEGTPWMPISAPEPYMAPKSKYSAVLYYAHDSERWVVSDGMNHVADNIPTREAAERIAAIYNEVMP